MKTLRSLGLKNPRIIMVRDVTKVGSASKFALICDNYKETEALSKTFVFFEQLFDKFLIGEVEAIRSEIVRILTNNEVDDEDTTLVNDMFLPYIEKFFSTYLDDTKSAWECDYKMVMQIPFSYTWKHAPNPIAMLKTEEDKSNSVLFFCYGLKSEDLFRLNKRKWLEIGFTRILMSRKMLNVRPNAYYHDLEEYNLDAMKLATESKEYLKQGKCVIYLMDTVNDKLLEAFII